MNPLHLDLTWLVESSEDQLRDARVPGQPLHFVNFLRAVGHELNNVIERHKEYVHTLEHYSFAYGAYIGRTGYGHLTDLHEDELELLDEAPEPDETTDYSLDGYWEDRYATLLDTAADLFEELDADINVPPLRANLQRLPFWVGFHY